MEKLYRDQFSHFINITPEATTEDWALEGIGVEALAMSFNPQVSQYKQIIDRNANADFDNYQIQSSVSGKRLYKGDAIYEFVNTARKRAKAIETQLLEIDMAETKGESYEAIKYNILIVINEFLGDSATISYDLYVKGDPTLGTATIVNKKPTFVESIEDKEEVSSF